VRNYEIRRASGEAGPKLREGDGQVPEGLYRIDGLNPNSSYHLSLKINYPNEFDRQQASIDGRTQLGGDIFIHGREVSIGCLAMGDDAIEELFVLAHRVGKENISVLLAPRDFRQRPISGSAGVAWVDTLYSQVRQELKRYRY
jgi:murein L,D-transpeptidase YafK